MSVCDRINCGYYYADENDDYPTCHCPDDLHPAPCEDDDPVEDEEEDVENGEGFFVCRVCGVIIIGTGACYNCGYDPEECEPGDFKEGWTRSDDEEEDDDPFNENDPYVVTNPMAFY